MKQGIITKENNIFLNHLNKFISKLKNRVMSTKRNNDQYFALIDNATEELVIGKRVDDTLFSETEPDELSENWESIDVEDNPNGDGFLSKCRYDDDEIEFYNNCNIYAFTPLTKKRYEELKASKKERNALEKQLIKEHDAGIFRAWTVRKIGDSYVFGCGELVTDKKQIKQFLELAALRPTKEKELEELGQQIDDLQEKYDSLEEEIDSLDDNLDYDVSSAMSNNGVNFDNLSAQDIKEAKKLLTV